MISAVALIFLAALCAPALQRLAPRFAALLLALVPLAQFLRLLMLAPGPESLPWAPNLGLDLAFQLDGLSRLMALLVTGIGTLVTAYSGAYLKGHVRLGRYYAALLLFMGSMLGLVLADNFLLLFVFWELTSLSSYLLIGFDHEREAARKGALQALLVTGAGGLAMLAGIVLAAQIAATSNLSVLVQRGEALRAHPLFPAVLTLLLLGAFSKSAQFPFHFWLPNAMEAPTPASAYLHAATMVKAGVYLLARLSPAFAASSLWTWSVTAAGALTMLAGAWLALSRADLKQILAYSTVSALGVLTLLLGVGGPHAWTAVPAYLLAHGLYKGALFLVTGAVDHEAGTRRIDQLGGLRKAMPWSAAAALLAGLSMAGLPPLAGFIAKELVYETALASAWIAAAAVLASILLFAVSGLAAIRPFFGPPATPPKTPHEAPLGLLLPPLLLALLGLASGFFPGPLNPLVQSAAASIAGHPVPAPNLALFHGWSPALALSLLTAAAGAALYFALPRARFFGAAPQTGPACAYDGLLHLLNRAALRQTRILQSGYLRIYLLVLIVTTLTLVGAALARRMITPPALPAAGANVHEVILALSILVSTLVAVRAESRLASIAALGVIGIAVALIFALFGAPDLAMTQFVVETLTVVLLVLIMRHLPDFATFSRRAGRIRDAAISIAAGAMMALLVAVSAEQQHGHAATRFYLDNSLALAHGRNVVNVILTDFRVLDTLGEITVLAVAAVGVHSLLRLRRRKMARP